MTFWNMGVHNRGIRPKQISPNKENWGQEMIDSYNALWNFKFHAPIWLFKLCISVIYTNLV